MPRWFKFDALPPSRPNPNSRPISFDREPTDEELLATDNFYHLIGMQDPALRGADGPDAPYLSEQSEPEWFDRRFDEQLHHGPWGSTVRPEPVLESTLGQANALDQDVADAQTYNFEDAPSALSPEYGRYEYLKSLLDPQYASLAKDEMRSRIQQAQNPVRRDGVTHSNHWGLNPLDSTLASLPLDPDEVMNFVARRMFPGLSLEAARKRVVRTRDGIAYRAADGRYYAAFPEIAFTDLAHGGPKATINRTTWAAGPIVTELGILGGRTAGTFAGGALGGPQGAYLGNLAGGYFGALWANELRDSLYNDATGYRTGHDAATTLSKTGRDWLESPTSATPPLVGKWKGPWSSKPPTLGE